jgi:hypothetical protein
MSRAGNPRQATKLIHKTLDKTQHLLSNKATWAAVKAIAKELLEHESISGRAAKHHLEIAHSNKNLQ